MSTNVGQAHIDITANTKRAHDAVRAFVQQAKANVAAVSSVTIGGSIKLKAPTKAEVSAALSGVKAEKVVAIKIDSADAATRIGQIRTLLQGLGTTVSGLFNVNTAGLGAILSGGTSMITQFQAVVASLRQVLAEIRNTRPPTGPPAASGAGGSPGANLNPYAAQLRALQGDLRAGALTTAQFEQATRALQTAINGEITSLRSLGVLTTDQQRKLDALRGAAGQTAQALGRVGPSAGAGVQQLARDLQVAQSKYDRGATSLRTYLREMERIRTAGQGMAAGLAAGSQQAQALERVMGGLSTASQRINTSSITKIRADLAAARAEFERATAAAGRFADKRAATQAYERSMRELEGRIRAVGERSNVTAGQVGQLNRITSQLASQRNALNGMFTPLSLSGGVLNALRSLPQFAMQAGGSLGAAAVQASSFAGGLGGIGAAAGPAGLAVAGAAAAVVAFGAAAAVAVDAYATFQNNIQNAKATLGLFGKEGQALGKDLANLAQSPALTKLGFDSNQAAKAIEELGSRGLDTSEILGGGLQTAATLAAASGVKDLSVSAEVLVGTMRAFGIEGKDAAKVPDLLANAANVSALKLEDFRLAIAAGGSAARTANIDVTEFTAVMSLMRDRLISASDAGTSFKAFTAAFTANSEPAAAAMAEIGFNAFDSAGKIKPLRQIVEQLAVGLKGYTDEQRLATLETIFGADGVRTATTLLDAYNTQTADGTRLLDERTGALTRQGTADLAAKERTDSLRAAQAELANKVLLLKQRLGEQLAPAVTALISSFSRFLDKVNPAVEKLGELVGLLDKVKSPGEIRAVLKITAADDTTTAALKFVMGTGQAVSAGGNPITRNIMLTIARLVSSLGVQDLQVQLQKARVVETPGSPGAARAQQREIAANREKYEKLLAEALARNAAASERLAGTLGVNVPGQPKTGPTPKTAQDAGNEFGQTLASAALKGLTGETTNVAGECSKFLRQVFQIAFPKAGRELFGSTALETEQRFARAGLTRAYTGPQDLKAGEFVFNKNDKSGKGHGGLVVILNGKRYVAENSSAVARASATGDARGLTPIENFGGISSVGNISTYAPVTGRVAPNVGPVAARPAAAQTQTAANRKLLDEAQHLYNQQQAALKSGNDAWLLKVNTSITAFKRKHAEVWRSIEQTNKKGAADLAKTGVSDADYKKFQQRAKELAQLEARTRGKGAAQAAADREIAAFVKKNGDAAKQVLEYERDALKRRADAQKRARDEQATIAREAEQGRLEAARNGLERLKTLQNRALALAGDDAAARARITRDNASAVAAAQKKIAEGQLKIDEAAARKLAPGLRGQALTNAQTRYQNSLREIETERLSTIRESGKTLKEEQAKLDADLREGRVADARLTLERIEKLNERELINFKGTAEARQKVVVRQANAEAQARRSVALAQKKLDDAAAQALPAGQQAAALTRSESTYRNTLRDIENTRLRATQDAGKTLKEEQARLDQELREGRVADARLTLERIEQLNARELISFKGTADARQKLVVQQANEEAAARKKVALAQKALDDAAARALTDPAARTAALARSQTTYQNAVREVENTRLRAVQDANKTLKEEQGRLDADLREGRVADARLTLERIQQLNQLELDGFAGTMAQREQIVRRQADAELAAKKKIALAQKVLDDAAARQLTPGLQAGALARSKTTYENAVRQAQLDRNRVVQEAKAATAEEVKQAGQRQAAAKTLERELRQLNERFAQQVTAGTVTADSLLRYQQALEDARAKAAELPPALWAGITTLLTQGKQLGTSGQQVANYRSEIDKLKGSVDGWAYAELTAARARVIAGGGDAKKLAILDAEIAKRETLTTETLAQVTAESQVAQARSTADGVEGEYANAQASARGNFAQLYALELQFGARVQAARDARAQAEAADDQRAINEKYDKLAKLEGITDAQLREVEAARSRDLLATATRLTNALAKNASDRTAAELDAKRALDDALRGVDRETRDTLRKNALAGLQARTRDVEAALAAELDAEDLTEAQKLAIRKKFQPQLLAAKQAEVAQSRQIDEQAELDRYQDAVEAARQNGTLDRVAQSLRQTHLSNMGAIGRRYADEYRDYELGVKRDTGKQIVATERETSDGLKKEADERLDTALAGLEEMTGAQRAAARATLEAWRESYAAQGKAGEAAVAQIDAALKRLSTSGDAARRKASELVVGDPAQVGADFARKLGSIGKPANVDSARADAEQQFQELYSTYQTGIGNLRAALEQFGEKRDQDLTPDERRTRDGLQATLALYSGFLAQTKVASLNAGDQAATAFTQAEKDGRADGALALVEAEYTRAEAEGRDGSPAYRAGLNAALAYWRARRDGLDRNSPEYLAALQKVVELEGKAAAVSPEKIRDQEEDRALALLEARHALAEAEGRDDGPAYLAGLKAALAYWRARLKGLVEGTPEYLAALQKITDLEGKIKPLSKSPLVGPLQEASRILGRNGPLQSAISSGLDGLAAYFDAGGKGGGRGAILTGAAVFVGGLVDVFKTGDEDVDRVVGGFVSGLQATLMQLAQGNWIGALISGVATVITTLIDIFRGGRNSARKAAQEIADATKDVRFFDLSKYAKVVSRGGFFGFLGFKKSEIDQEAVEVARTLGDAIYEAISGGMLDGIKAGKTSFSDLGLDLKKSLAQNILQGLIDGFLKGEVMKNIIQPFLDKFIAARKTADPTDDVQATAELQQAVVSGNAELANFYNTVLVPTAKDLGVFGVDAEAGARNLGGNAAQELELPQSVQVRLNGDLAAQQQQAQALSGLTKVIDRLDGTLALLQRNGMSADLLITQPLQQVRTRIRTGALLG